MKYEVVYIESESALKNGQIELAKKHLERITPSQIPSHWKLKFAQLCRRSGSIRMGLNLLKPIIVQKNRSPNNQIENSVVAEYALLLEKVGAYDEANYHLTNHVSNETSDVIFAKAALAIGQWDYESALPLLIKFCKMTQLPYSKAIGQVNLAAVLASLQKNIEALKILDETQELCETNKWLRLLSNIHEIRAQISIFKNKTKEAKNEIQKSFEIIQDSTSLESIHIKKWSAVIKAIEIKSVQPLLDLKKLMKEQKQTSTMRDLDLQILKIQFDQNLFDHIYFGTSFNGYKNHIERELGRKNSSLSYVYGPKNSPCLDLSTFEISDWTKGKLKPVKKTHQLLQILFQELYGSIEVGYLFSKIFKGEYYNTLTSPRRVKQIVYRARKWLVQEKIPISIEEHNGCYFVHIKGDFSVRIHRQDHLTGENEILFKKLAQIYNSRKEFKSKNVRENLQLSYGRSQRFLTWAIAHNLIKVNGIAKLTTYTIVQKSSEGTYDNK